MKLAHKYALDAILKENQNIKGIIVYAPAMEWNVPLLQRPQHLAFQMAAKGYLYFYCTDNRHFDKISGFEKITDRCYVTDQHDLIIQSDLPFIYHLNSICPGKIDSDIFERINENHITIYDYIDHIHEYISGSAAEFIYKRHRLINPDIITCTARVLVDEMLQRFPSDKVYYLPNAAEYEHFHIKKEVADLPEDIKPIVNKNRPIIGYFGALARWVDYNLINLLAEKRPDAEIILIGWDFDGSQKLLKERANLHVLGARPYAILPEYAIWFDIATIPFSDVDISSSTSPIKLYEYMALGKPIVTTDVFECKRYRSVMAAQDHKEFLLLVDRAFKLKDDEDYLKSLDDEAKRNTWEARASELEEAIGLRQQRVDNLGYGVHSIKEPLVVHEPNDKQPLSSKSSEILEAEKVDRHSSKYNGPMVSIIIPTCDRPGFLKEALQSVLSQTYRNFEIIVINDGGRDISGDINSLENSGKIIYLRHEDRRGPSAVRNTGLKQARGKYIAYLDDDDVYYPNHLETLVVFLEKNNYKVAYTDSYQAFQTWITDRYVTIDKKIKYNFDFDREKFLVGNYIHIISIVHRKGLLDEVGLFDESLETHEDWDMCIRLSQKYDFYHIKAVTAEFRTRDDMSSATNIKRVDFLRTLRLIHKRYSHLVTDPNILEAQKRLEKSLAMEVEIRQLSSSLMEYECLHQYRFAKEFVKNKKVLVLGGGKGYGSFILSEDAESVTCIDKDERNLRYGSSNYMKENLEFIKGSITDVPVKEEKTFDVIVYFEALEQIEEHNELMKEVKRLLKEDGIFVVSTPNKHISSDQLDYHPPPQLKELSFDEFKSLLKKNFKNTLIYGQKVYPSSNIFPFFKSSVTTKDYAIEKGDRDFLFVPQERKGARYLIAVSSDGRIKDITGDSYLVDISETLFKLKDGQIRNLEAAIREKDAHTGNLETVVRGKDVHIANLEAAVRGKDGQISNLEAAVKGKDGQISNLEAAIREKDAHTGNLETVVRDKDVHIANLEAAVRGKDARIGNLDAAIRERDVDISNLEAVIKDKDQRIINLDAATREKDVHISNLEALIRDKNTHTSNLEAAVREKEAYIHHIHSGHGWRLLTKYFRARDRLLPQGTKRRAMAKFIWRLPDLITGANIRKSIRYANIFGLKGFFLKAEQRVRTETSVAEDGRGYESLYSVWIEENEPKEDELVKQRNIKFAYEPKISIIVPAYNTPEKFLIAMINSILNQTYSNWELCIADGSSKGSNAKKLVKSYARKDDRIKVRSLDENKGMAGNSDEALALAEGEFIGLLDHDDTLAPFALYEVVKAINENPDADFIYSDEDKITEDGKTRSEPHFKPGWAPDTMLSYNYICHFSVIKKVFVDKVGGFRLGYDGSQDYDLFLRILFETTRIVHIPKILYHWRISENSVAGNVHSKLYAYESSKKALRDHLSRSGLRGEVEDGNFLGSYRVRYDIEGEPKVSIIIPNKDKVSVLKKCVTSILEKSTYKNYEIIILENNSIEKGTFDYYETISKSANIRVVRCNDPFNYSALNNLGVKNAAGEFLIFLNNDTEVITSNWIENMLEHAQRKDIGAVGAKLYYPDGEIQHAGVILGLWGLAGHPHYRFPKDSHGYIGRLKITQNLSAVTGACMMMRKEVFNEVDGFNEEYSHAYNDIDLCMKLREKGYLIIYTPYVELYHHESLSRGNDDRPEERARVLREVKLFKQNWGDVLERGDPYYNPNLTLEKDDYGLRIERKPSINVEMAAGVKEEHNTGTLTLGEAIRQSAEIKLKSFLTGSESNLEFPKFQETAVSIIIVTYNKAWHTYKCLESLKANADVPYEVIIVDNASRDETGELLRRLRQIKIIRNTDNYGFVKACNQGSKMASGRYILFLNNDTEVLPKSLSKMVATIERDDKCGAVGARLILPDGRLQEAGDIIWSDGSALGYGRYDNPFKPEYSYLREVDYCSGACLLVRAELFAEMGGFDERYAPAYYEEADFCLSLRSRGYKVVYQPAVNVVHYEFGSSSLDKGLELMKENQTKFVNKWRDVLKEHYPNKPENILYARDKSHSHRILFIDERTPALFLGAGYPRAYKMLHFLSDLGYKVTFFPLQYQQLLNPSTQYLESLGIEMFYDDGTSRLDLGQFLSQRPDYYDTILVSRPDIAREAIEIVREKCPKAAIIYDAEALFSEREIIRRNLEGINTSQKEEQQMINREISLMKRADVIVIVSEVEKETVVRNGVKDNVMVWGHPVEIRATKKTFRERQDILFVGGFINPGTPNADSILYFAKKVYPMVRDRLGVRLFVVGSIHQDIRKELNSPSIIVTGHVDDLMEYYDNSRIFIVPTRYAAGIPLKLLEAMSYGVPSVVTPLVGKQLRLTHKKEVLIGGSAEEFAESVISLYEDEMLWNQLRAEGYRHIKEECSPQKLRKDLDEIVKLAKQVSKHI